MVGDKGKEDNQKRITKGISLAWVSLWFVKRFLHPSDWPSSLAKECTQKKEKKKETLPSTEHLFAQMPPSPTLTYFYYPLAVNHLSAPLSLPPYFLPVASRLAVTHLAPPKAHNRRLVCEEGQEFRFGWGSIPPSTQRRPALRVYNYLPLAFSTGSSTVQALAPALGDALGYTLGD